MNWQTAALSGAVFTNIAVFLAVTSLLYWVGEVKSGWMRRHHDGIQYAICAIYLVYLIALMVINAHVDLAGIEKSWLFINPFILGTALMNILMISTRFATITTGLTLGLLLATNATPSWPAFGLLAIIIVGQYWFAAHGRKIWNNRMLTYPLLLVYGGAFIALIALGGLSPVHDWDWRRQLVLFLFQVVCSYEYVQLLVARRRVADMYRSESTEDQLTGLKNMASFSLDLEDHFTAYKESGTTFSLYELDIDLFKCVNDTYGHPMGNDVLIQTARVMQDFAATLPTPTTVYRLGGEEFGLIVADDTQDPAVAANRGLALQAAIGALHFRSEESLISPTFQVTVSMGITTVQPEDVNYHRVYQRADQFLYAAKQSGRDAICVHGRVLRSDGTELTPER